VNGKLVSFDTKLRNGDIIEILKSKPAHPTAKWIDYARTSMARRHIRATLDASDRGRPNSEPVKQKKERTKEKKGKGKK
jgi:(p)ppGpp synthase/HD superfamily hydrolase